MLIFPNFRRSQIVVRPQITSFIDRGRFFPHLLSLTKKKPFSSFRGKKIDKLGRWRWDAVQEHRECSLKVSLCTDAHKHGWIKPSKWCLCSETGIFQSQWLSWQRWMVAWFRYQKPWWSYMKPCRTDSLTGPRIRSQNARRMVKGPYTFEFAAGREQVDENDNSPVEKPLVSTKLNLGVRSGPKSRVTNKGKSSANRRFKCLYFPG